MSVRASPAERIGAEIDELFASNRDLAEVLEAWPAWVCASVMQVAARCLRRLSNLRHLLDHFARRPSRRGWRTTSGVLEWQHHPITPSFPSIATCASRCRRARATRAAGRVVHT
ncbi:MAG: hypothetical protein LC808_09860, partial [Actinobacteria bacterium]|nr:hypothetical protein [Actinomycetota bacterium]